MPTKQPAFYGWTILVVAWFAYGFSISPGYYSWSIVSPSIVADLGLSREQAGTILGLFIFLLGAVAPLVGVAINRYGARVVIPIGCLISGTGFVLMSRADSYLDCILSFSILGGVGIAFASQVPTQTLAANWFTRYRARAMGLILTAGGVVGKAVPYADQYLMERESWRLVWIVAACIAGTLAIATFLLVRNRPSDLGQFPDGEKGSYPQDKSVKAPEDDSGASARNEPQPSGMTLRQALRTPQFYVLCFAGMACTMPYNVVASHGLFHFADIGFGPSVAAGMIGTMALFSVFGRLIGALGDLIRPIKLLGVALIFMGAAMAVLLSTKSSSVAGLAIMIFAIGHGLSYTSSYAVFPTFFGVGSFSTMAGTMGLVAGTGGFLATRLTGRAYDQTGSYQTAFTTVVAIIIVIGLIALFTRPPRNASAL